MVLPLDAASLGLAGLGVAGLGVAGLGSINLVAPPSRRPKDYAPSPLRPFPVSPQCRRQPQTPQMPQTPLKAAYIGKRPHSSRKKPPHRMGQHQIDIDKRSWPIRKAKLPVGVTVLWPSLFRAGQHARNRTGIWDRSGGKPAGLRLMSALHIHAKNNAR